MIILGAMIFGYFLTVTGVSSTLASSVVELDVNRYLVLVGIIGGHPSFGLHDGLHGHRAADHAGVFSGYPGFGF